MHCGPDCKPSGVLDLAPMFRSAPVGQWRKAIVRLSCLRESGADLTRVAEPFVLQSRGRAQITLGDIRLEPALNLKTCPPDMHGQD
jgi:beta-glucosidase